MLFAPQAFAARRGASQLLPAVESIVCLVHLLQKTHWKLQSYVDGFTGRSYTSTLLEAVTGHRKISHRMVHCGMRQNFAEWNYLSLESLEDQVAKDCVRRPTRRHLRQGAWKVCFPTPLQGDHGLVGFFPLSHLIGMKMVSRGSVEVVRRRYFQ